jgi:hypothetical protein
MLIKATLIIVIVLYVIILVENLAYRLAFAKFSFLSNAVDYIEFERVVGKDKDYRIVVLYFILLAISLNLVAFCCVNPKGFLFLCSLFSFVLLVADIVLLIKVDIPLNKKLKKRWPQKNCEFLRRKSNRLHFMRQLLIIWAFLTLIVGVVFGL